MKLDLHQIHARLGCRKPGCGRHPTYRHHRGGEHTFVTHFKDRGRKWRLFCRRYHEFNIIDVIEICGDHHEEIHELLWDADADWMGENGCIKAFRDFSWEEAEKLMVFRRTLTDLWLANKTPGSTNRRFTNYP